MSLASKEFSPYFLHPTRRWHCSRRPWPLEEFWNKVCSLTQENHHLNHVIYVTRKKTDLHVFLYIGKMLSVTDTNKIINKRNLYRPLQRRNSHGDLRARLLVALKEISQSHSAVFQFSWFITVFNSLCHMITTWTYIWRSKGIKKYGICWTMRMTDRKRHKNFTKFNANKYNLEKSAQEKNQLERNASLCGIRRIQDIPKILVHRTSSPAAGASTVWSNWMGLLRRTQYKTKCLHQRTGERQVLFSA